MDYKELFEKPVKEGVKKVYILGAGVSGLSLAYYLMKLGSFDITIFEKAKELGGNCRTFNVEINNGSKPLTRWADMGVNDYNQSSYHKLNDLMKATGYVEGLPLEDTESYGTLDGSICYTNDGEYFTPMSKAIAADTEKFQKEAFKDLQDPKYAYYTLGEYVTEKRYTPDYINNNLYPRVNGMYFCAGSPAEMPFRGVMSYYSLQEGYGGDQPPKRKYFKNGTSAWIDSLCKKITEMAGHQIIYYEADAEVIWTKGQKPRLKLHDVVSPPFDAVILSTPADDAIKAFGGSMKMPPEVLDVLVQFPYVTDQAIVHTDVRSLQPQVNSWRTYNIHIFDSKAFNYGPYTIDYVVNRHQNDPANAAYNKNCQNPQYFVSLNPVVAPSASSVLQQSFGKGPAVTEFRHQKLSINTIRAQEKLQKVQGLDGLWYVNGYALGAGLHEECLHHADDIAHMIANKPKKERVHYKVGAHAGKNLVNAGADDAGENYAPDYIINAHKKH